MGGGIGIPPMLELAKELDCEKDIIAGYRNSELFLADELKQYGNLYVATEDGSEGTKGNVMNAIAENNLKADVILHVDLCQCFVQLRNMHRSRIFQPIFPWKREWHVA